jgi:hypothetical protein
MNRTLPILLAATMALFMIGCGSSGGGDAPPASGGGGSTPGTGTTNDNSTRHYRITSAWSPDTPTGIALNDSGHTLKLATVNSATPRTVNSTIVWGETTSPTVTTIGTATAHLVTALPDVSYVDDLYVTTKTSGTTTLELDSILHQAYRLTFTIPVTTSNADGVTSIKFQSGWLSPVAAGKHYVDTTLWTIYATKATTTPTYGTTIVPNNPLMVGAAWTDSATNTGLVLTIDRAHTLGKLVIVDNATNNILSAFATTTLVPGTAPDSSVTVTLPYARATGATYRIVYADPDLSDDIVYATQGTAGVSRTSWP